MKKRHAFAIAATTLGLGACSAASVPPGDVEFETAESAITVTRQTGIGDVTIVVPPEVAPVKGSLHAWKPVPGLSGAIQSSARGNLAITVTAEMFGKVGAYLRARVDGRNLLTVPLFVAGSESHDDVRAFTFVAPGVSAGQHTVEIEWQSASTTEVPQMRDRSLTMHSATATGIGKLVVNQSRLAYTVNAVNYDVVPGTEVDLSTTDVLPLAITFSSDADVSKGRLFAQAVVDGAVMSDVLVAEAGALTHRASRSYTFVVQGIKPGAHHIEIRARAEGGAARIYANTVTVATAPATSADGGMVALGAQVAPTTITSAAYVDVPSLATLVSTSAGASTAIVETGGEVQVKGGRLFLRALIDGVPARPGNVTFLQDEAAFRAQSFSFAIDNLTPGRHQIQIQASVDPGATALLGDRFLRVHHARRSGAAFVQGYNAMRPQHRSFRTLVVCFDPLRPGQTRPTKQQVVDHFEGTDGGQSARGWWAENSNQRLTSSTVQYVGCDDGAWFEAPPGRQGNWYWDNAAWNLMWQDALAAADPTIDFHAYDADANDVIDPTELQVAIVRPQNGAYGTTRGTTMALDGISTPLGVNVSDLYLSAMPSQRQTGVGLIGHEFSHSQTGAQDIYAPCPAETNAGSFSVMSWHGEATHNDPFHKLKSGFVTPDAITIPTWTTSTLQLPAVETGAHEVTVLYDPARADREYFVVENRYGGTAGVDATYDRPLGNNVVVWHVIEDEATRTAFPFPAPNAGCRIPVRLLKTLNAVGASYDLTWADGTPAKIRVTVASAPAAATSVELAKLP